ncbi:UDP-2,3-diacylglucosamine diphosphatase [uncultured Acinetobacter sp.]|uniref:UDP-2,3-diacylglucosamine diphosphatase n=1 Tax=uncultured Acinetobacter sp. TaxID=165433 RepID=UPI00262A26F2|nr:UDP-2,3-diacylglucosamine diphosphatase [uncultured Acinetobacter sp.]
MTYLFIADLHLSPQYPRLTRGFLDLLHHYQHCNTQLYILGDWFNAWIGDDQDSPWLDDIVNALNAFRAQGNEIFFLVGNRDFALGQKFLDRFGGTLLNEVTTLKLGCATVRLEHGDGLCTDDISYQRFKKIIRNPILLRLLKATPLIFRQKLANGFRKKSQQANQVKSYSIMDVNQQAVEHALENVDILIHGHTHRPNIHDVQGKPRIVLGDWREEEAQILVIDDQTDLQKLTLTTWVYALVA